MAAWRRRHKAWAVDLAGVDRNIADGGNVQNDSVTQWNFDFRISKSKNRLPMSAYSHWLLFAETR